MRVRATRDQRGEFVEALARGLDAITCCGPTPVELTVSEVAAMNVTVHAAETSIDKLTSEYLPLLLQTADSVTAAWSHLARLPIEHAASAHP